MATPSLPGFKVANEAIKPRLIISVEALEKSGKTNFAFTAPGPIGYLPFDVGDEGVIQKFQENKTILVPTESYDARFDGNEPKIEAGREWKRFYDDYLRALKSLRSVVIDTGSESWDLLRLARLGKLTQVMPTKYVEVNQEFRDFVRAAYDHNANLIILHKQKAEWVNDAAGKGSKTGRHERAGFADMGFLVQINLHAYRLPEKDRGDDDLGFRLKIKDCRQNPEIAGMELENEMCNFQFLASLVYPEIDPVAWE